MHRQSAYASASCRFGNESTLSITGCLKTYSVSTRPTDIRATPYLSYMMSDPKCNWMSWNLSGSGLFWYITCHYTLTIDMGNHGVKFGLQKFNQKSRRFLYRSAAVFCEYFLSLFSAYPRHKIIFKLTFWIQDNMIQRFKLPFGDGATTCLSVCQSVRFAINAKRV